MAKLTNANVFLFAMGTIGIVLMALSLYGCLTGGWQQPPL